MLVLLLAIAAAIAAYGFTATNTVPGSNAGDGQGTISGYDVSSIAYTLSASDPTLIDKVDFTLDQSAGDVKAKVDASSTTYTDCTVTGGTSVSCDFASGSEPAVVDADELRVIAVQ